MWMRWRPATTPLSLLPASLLLLMRAQPASSVLGLLSSASSRLPSQHVNRLSPVIAAAVGAANLRRVQTLGHRVLPSPIKQMSRTSTSTATASTSSSASFTKSRPSPPSPFRRDLLHQHVALVTGGGSGIGLEIAHQLGLHGATVVCMGRRAEVLSDAVQWLKSTGVEAMAVSGDVRKEEDCRRAVDETVRRYGRLDILVNCAAGKSGTAASQ